MPVCACVCQMLLEVVAKTLKHHGIGAEHRCFQACSRRLFDISKFYLKVSPAHTHTRTHGPLPLCAWGGSRHVLQCFLHHMLRFVWILPRVAHRSLLQVFVSRTVRFLDTPAPRNWPVKYKQWLRFSKPRLPLSII